MRRVAIIPARGGSKRFPGKNIALFCGQPIIAYTIQSASSSGCFDNIVVSTDDDEVEDIVRHYGADVDRRPAALAVDEAKVQDVCLEFLKRQRIEGNTWDVMCCLYATAALQTADDIRGVISLIKPGSCEFAMGVSQTDRYVHQALIPTGQGYLKPKWPEMVEQKAQESDSYWFSNGTTYAVWIRSFEEGGSFYGPSLKGYFMPREHAVDIDTLADLRLAEYFYSSRKPY